MELTVRSRAGDHPLVFEARHLVTSGYTGRQDGDVERHVAELARLGIPRPSATPVFCAVASYLLARAGAIEVQGPFTSGEAEFVLLFGPTGPWVGLGSDQTDRFIQRHSVPAAKQLCPKVLGPDVWPLSEVEAHWDELRLRTWVRSGRRRRLYQEATLAALLPPSALISALRVRVGRALDGVVLFSGTVPTVDGEVVYGDGYEMELTDPRLERALRLEYRVRVLEPSGR